MITRIVRMEFQEDKLDEFQHIFDQSKQKIRNFPGCHQLELHRDARFSNVLFTYSIWESEQHLESYRNSELFAAVWPKTKALFSGRPLAYSMKQLERID